MSAHIGLYFSDEGYLWYGAQRVLAGEIPLRDFDSYDPGRYYWAAAVMALLRSHGLVALRVAVALLAAAGAWVAMSLVLRDRQRVGLWFCLMAAITFPLWMFVQQKAFDVTASIALVALLTWLIEQPTRYRCFMNGVGLGIVAIVGRNHGLYGAIADMGALVVLAWTSEKARFSRSFIAWSLGVLVGYAPMLVAAIVVPGFSTWLWVSIRVLFETGSTNNSVPIPWPWLVPLSGQPLTVVSNILAGIGLMALPLFGVAGTVYSVWRVAVKKLPGNPVVLAASLLAVPYTHFAYSRAGLGHLSQACFPMLIGLFTVCAALPRRAAVIMATAICGLSLFATLPQQMLYYRWTHGEWTDIAVQGDTLSVEKSIAEQVGVFSALVSKYAPDGKSFIAVPFLPGIYPIFDRRAAVWDIYPLYHADAMVQQAEITRIQSMRPGFVLVQQGSIDNNLDLTYSHTYPLVYDFIRQHFVRVSDALVPPYMGWDIYIPAGVVQRAIPDNVNLRLTYAVGQ